jgi:hypothetical protein
MLIMREVCDVCSDERPEWWAAIAAQLTAEFGEWPKHWDLCPPSHPFMARYNALWDSHKRPCAVFFVGEPELHICAQHLRAVADIVDAPVQAPEPPK